MTKASWFLLCPLGWHIKRMASSPASRLCGCWDSAGWCWNSSCCHSAKEGPSTKDSDNFQPHIPRVEKQSIPFLSPQWSVSAPQWWVLPFMNKSYLEMIPQTWVHLVSPIAYMSHQNSNIDVSLQETRFLWKAQGSSSIPAFYFCHEATVKDLLCMRQEGPYQEASKPPWSLSLPSLKNGKALTYFSYKLPSLWYMV